MEKIDRLGWAAGICLVAYGVRVGIRVNKPEVVDRIPDLLPPGWKPATSPLVDRLYSLLIGGAGPQPHVRRFNLLYANEVKLARTMDLDEVFNLLESDLQLYVAETARRRLFVHAGVVGWHGQAIVIPGRSFSGKTTLVAALVKAGATYYSDEYAVFDANGRVYPFPKPLSIRDKNGKVLRRFPAEELGGLPGVKPVPVGLVVISRCRPGARGRRRVLSPGRGGLALLANTVSARRHPELALVTLPQVVSHALVFKGVRGEAKEMVDSLLSKFRGERAPVVLVDNGRPHAVGLSFRGRQAPRR